MRSTRFGRASAILDIFDKSSSQSKRETRNLPNHQDRNKQKIPPIQVTEVTLGHELERIKHRSGDPH